MFTLSQFSGLLGYSVDCLYLSPDITSVPMIDTFNGMRSFMGVVICAPAPLKMFVIGTDKRSAGKHRQSKPWPNNPE